MGEASDIYEGTVFSRLHESIRKKLVELGYKKPTPIQDMAIPPAIEGKSIVGIAQTGTGKTAAFLLPTINGIIGRNKKQHCGHPQALILEPTLELVVQTYDCIKPYFVGSDKYAIPLYGKVGLWRQIQDIKRNPDIITSTSTRIRIMMEFGIVYLDQLKTLVIDEMDTMLDLGFREEIEFILKRIPKTTQVLLFSATTNSTLKNIINALVPEHEEISATAANKPIEKIEQYAVSVNSHTRFSSLTSILDKIGDGKTIVFTRTKVESGELSSMLNRKGYRSDYLSGDKMQFERLKTIKGFKRGDFNVIVATDVAARGVDISGLECAVNYEPPLIPRDYVHRIGRTGRAGNSGLAYIFVGNDNDYHKLEQIEKLINKKIPIIEL